MAPAPRITLLTRIALPIQTVFELWTRPEHVARWWGGLRGWVMNASIDARTGGEFWIAVVLEGGRGYDNVGKFSDVIPGEALIAEWEHGEGRTSQLVVQLLELGRVTEVTLTHREFPDEQLRDYHLARWQDALAELERYAARLPKDGVKP